MNRARILYLVPDLINPASGIARHSRIVCRALIASGFDLAVAAYLDDGHVPSEFADLVSSLRYQPCGGSRAAFVLRGLGMAMSLHPDIVITAHPHFAPVAWTSAQIAHAPWISFLHGIESWNRLSSLRRVPLARAERYFAVSHFTAQNASEVNDIDLARVRVLQSCLDPVFNSCRSRPAQRPTLSMLTVARMEPAEQYKGHDYVIRAMPRLLRQFPGLKYNIVGDGSLRPELEALAIAEGVGSAVQFRGVVSESDLQWHYANNSILIMPSRGEGFGFAFLEAMSQGLPVIGGNLDATPEVVVDGETGYLVEPTSIDSIVAAASRLLGDEQLRLKMGQAAVRHVAAHFSFDAFRDKLVSYLAELRPELFPKHASAG